MGKGKVMIVEDESIIAEDIRDTLLHAGYDVCAVVGNGEDAIRKAEEDVPGLVIMDIVLAGEMDGITAAREIRSRFDIPIIYLSAQVNKEYLHRAKITEPFGYLIKPIVYKELLTNIETALCKHKLETEIKEKNALLKRIMNDIIGTMARMVMIKIPFTTRYQHQVTRLSKAIAEEMDLSVDQIEGICLAAKVHDVGMISVPFEILSNPSPLGEDESDEYKSHVGVGYDLLKGIAFSWPVAEIVLQSHENMDGSGYPSGLKGKEILLEARIINVASTIASGICDRPGMPLKNEEEALDIIRQYRGIRYDADVVDACIKIIKEKGVEFEG